MATLNSGSIPYKFKQRDLYVGIKQINKEIARVNLLDIKRLLDNGNLYFGLTSGTLLGAIREHDFITHDQDTDLFILSEDEEKLKLLFFDMKKIGFNLIRYDRRGLYSVMRDGEYIDFNIYKPFTKGIRHSGSNYVLENHFTKTIEIDFLGAKFRVPADYTHFLAIKYGDDWRIPIARTTYDLSKIQVIEERTIVKIKRVLPEFLFFWLQYIHAKSKREIFFDRIKK
jgi:glycerol-3-phosphate cytidylyltransferase